MCRRDVSILRKSSDIFLTSKALIKIGVPDASDAPTTAVSPEKGQPSLLSSSIKKVSPQYKIITPQKKGKTNMERYFCSLPS